MIGNDECESKKTPMIYGQSAAEPLSPMDKGKVQRPFREEVGSKQNRSTRHQNKWSCKYDYCVVCGTTKFKHRACGICNSCYAGERREQQKEYRKKRYLNKEYHEKRLAQGRKWKKDNPDKVKAYSLQNYKEKREELLKQKNEFNHGGNYWAVLERDNFTCQRCGKHPVNIVHHIGKAQEKDKQVTLCRTCHTTIHKQRKVLEKYTMQCHKDSRFFDEDMVSSIKKLIES